MKMYESPTDRHANSVLRCLLLLACVSLVDGMSYMCLFPSYLRPGSDYNVSVTVFQASNPVFIEVAITGSNEIYTNSALANAKDTTVIVTVSIPVLLNDSTYALKIRGSGGLNFYNVSNVKVYRKTASVFIQTDKPMYSPGQTVLFTVVAVYPTMKPYTNVMDITMYDKERRKMGRWADYKSPKGYFSGEMQLSSVTPLGVWSIEVTLPSGMTPTIRTFEVMEYELPKFEVSIGSSFQYILLVKKPESQPPLIIPITATYTNGQPVNGVVELSASVIVDNRKTLEIMDPKWTKTVNLAEGKATAELSPEELSSIVPGIMKMKPTDHPWTQLENQNIYIVAKVTETATGDDISSSMIVRCVVLKYDFRFSNITSNSFQEGRNYTGYLELKQKNGLEPIESDIRLPNKDFRQIAMRIQANLGCSPKVVQKNFSLTISGFVRFSFEPQVFNCKVITLEASFRDELSNNVYYAYMNIEMFQSTTKQYIRVDLDRMNAAYTSGDELNFNIKTAQKIDAYYYVLMSKGSIVSAQTITNPSNPDVFKIMLDRELAQKISPKARIVVWCVASNSEVISDTIEFNVDGAFANEVTVAYGRTTVEPGKPLTVQVRGDPGSVAFVLAVDKSVFLLKETNDIKQKMALDDLMTYEFVDTVQRPRGITSEEILQRSLLKYMTDGLFYVYKPLSFTSVTLADVPFKPGVFFDSVDTFTRICFPETWLWASATIGDDGVGYFTVKAPDTITTFVTSAFAINERTGLGIARYRSEVTVFLPFFVSSSFPRRVRSGEQFPLRATVYNYLDASQTVRVTLKASLFFNVQQRNGVVNNVDVSRDIVVPRKDALSVSFWVITTKAGQIPIVVTATSGLINDLENKTILVIPEGVEQFYSKSLFVELTKSVPDFSYTFKIEVPSKTQLVPDSIYVEVTVVGDLLGASLNGVERLLQQPGGCGEQKMLRIGPLVYMTEYLSATNSLTADFEAKYKNLVLQGYQQELTAQRKDKSFSAWGNSDPSGSAWLSAYVVKTFNVAVNSNRLPIGKENLAATLEWIMNTQNPQGFFSEPDQGRVIHWQMQGGTGKGIPMTAYIVFTLIESRSNPYINSSLLEQSISKAVAYLEKQLDSITDSYTLCIVTYTLVLAKSSRAGDALKKRDALAQVSMDQKYWGQLDQVIQRRPGDFNPPYVQAPAIDVEMTSYALLTYVEQGRISEALPVVKWLLTQRNPAGGFVSTQDTVAALQALTRYAMVATGPRNSEVKVKARADTEEFSFYPITGSNVFILQKWEPRTTPQTIDVYATGIGIAIIQLNVRYNVYTVPVPENGGIKVDVQTEINGEIVTIRTCTSKPSGQTGMALQTIDPLSGYVPVNLNEGGWDKNVKKVEVDNYQIAIYYEKLDKDTTCVSVKLRKEFVVMLARNASISCLDYYNPGKFLTTNYGLKEPRQTWQSLCPPCNV